MYLGSSSTQKLGYVEKTQHKHHQENYTSSPKPEGLQTITKFDILSSQGAWQIWAAHPNNGSALRTLELDRMVAKFCSVERGTANATGNDTHIMELISLLIASRWWQALRLNHSERNASLNVAGGHCPSIWSASKLPFRVRKASQIWKTALFCPSGIWIWWCHPIQAKPLTVTPSGKGKTGTI